ncbi:transposable element Tc1 transposase [Trichonephila clavipes]|nr:transposable element Tc1 transposase [Trichonephila clavipes]
MCLHDEIRRNSNNLRSLNEDRLSALENEDFLSCNRSSCAAEQFHSDMSFEAVNQRAPNNSKKWQWMTEDESRFNSGDHDGHIRVRRYADERCLPECAIERHSGLSNVLRIEAQHMQLLSWSAYSPDISPIEHSWDLIGRRLAGDPRPVASKDKLSLLIQAIWNSLPHADFQNLFDSMPRRIAALIAARGGYTKY